MAPQKRKGLTDARSERQTDLLQWFGLPSKAVVLGDTGILGLCEATTLPQARYVRATGENIGFWAVVIPGVILKRQPLFNERMPVFHLDSSTVPLRAAMPQASHPTRNR